MIACYLQGGLGNQMFQIAASYNLAAEIGTEAVFFEDVHISPHQGRTIERYRKNVLSKVKFLKKEQIKQINSIYKEKKFSYEEIPKADNISLFGYFQSEKYFEKNKKKIRDLFAESEQTKTYIDEKYGYIQFEKCTSLHIRRGDYVGLQHIHPVCEKAYYDSAVEKISDNTEQILIFSDDIEWCKNNLKYKNITFVSDEDYNDLYLMARCKNNIIANSSFSWWAAWLNNDSDKKIVAPAKWFGSSGPQDWQDIYCKEWIIL